MRRITIVWAVVACCLPLCWLSGCGWQRHGLLIRGGCSLELNRLPWRTGVPVECDQEGCSDCELVNCAAGGSCSASEGAEAVPAGPAPAPPAAPISSGACYPRPCGPLSWLFAGLSGGGCGPYAGCQSGYMEDPLVETGPVQSRFHPVPTRPVFQSPPQISPPIAGGPFPQNAWPQPSASQVSASQPRQLAPPQKIHVPEPPAEPPTAPMPPGDREVQAPRRLGVASRDGSWVFPSASAREGWRTAQHRAGSGSDRATGTVR